MLTNEQIQQLHKESRDGYEFAHACYMAGMRDRMKIDIELAKQYPFSPVIGDGITEEIERLEL